MAKAPESAVIKIGPDDTKSLDYPEHKRAIEVYSHWMSGFTPGEIAAFFGFPLPEVKRDIQHIQSTLTVRQLIQQNNDRTRLIIQREQQEQHSRLLGDGLSKTIDDYLASGISPVGILREYRETVGLVQKPEPIIQVNTQKNTFIGGSGERRPISSPEDIIRKVLDQIQSPIGRPIDIQAEQVQDAPPLDDGSEDEPE